MCTINMNSKRALPVSFRAYRIGTQARHCIHCAYELFSIGFARFWLLGFWAFYWRRLTQPGQWLVSAIALALASEDDPRKKAGIGGIGPLN